MARGLDAYFCSAVYTQFEIERCKKHPAAKLAQLGGVVRSAPSL